MRYLTLEMIKKQTVVDPQFLDDDDFLESIGEAAEDYVEQMVNQDLDEITSESGDLPKCLYHAMLIVCDYLYAVQRGSDANDHDMPEAVNKMIKLYRSFV